jgi:hypothetical protein
MTTIQNNSQAFLKNIVGQINQSDLKKIVAQFKADMRKAIARK